MDNGLVLTIKYYWLWVHIVLILVVVDNGLVQELNAAIEEAVKVLILVVVDNGLVPLTSYI